MEQQEKSLEQTIVGAAQALQGELVRRRRDLHAHPEPGWCEMRTATLIARRLTELGYEVLTGADVCRADARMGLPDADTLEAAWQRARAQFLPAVRGGFTGVIGILRCGAGPTVALRFDIDALPVTESADPGHLPVREGFASQDPGFMHACGHDGHTTIGLGTAQLLMQLRGRLHGTVKLIFQPAEEGVRGAKSIVAAGHLDGVDYVLGGHMGGVPELDTPVIGIGDGSTLATTKFDVIYTGKPAHAGFCPELGKNAMLAAATAVLNLYAIPRHGAAPTQINVGTLTAGTGRNVVADRARLAVEVRGNTAAANQYMQDYAFRVVRAAGAMHDCGCEILLMGAADCTKNTPLLCDRLADIADRLGLGWVKMQGGASGSEDYSYFSERVQQQGGQSCYFSNLVRCAGPFHNSSFDFDEVGLWRGAALFTAAVCDLLGAAD